MGITGEVSLNGKLICTTEAEAARVRAALPDHITLTRAEAGCISFEVTPTDDPMIWSVAERFVDAAAFEAHQQRASTSQWAKETAGIARDYKITGL
ncbi:putative quinol monooxygenase [Sulfitobacter donghicola]|uniref:Antibiotic biosynthesis monooxygenase n=1 Tax=Sulfitobacter donghicola DSW-25 = KCTC 12864 = JCM 14565 TaxID=1300350 RepID=A0A073IDF3_9RHOB|nr:antibiotic biosynthesis monooxygenase [Sulfitobacter donghicola]KEJ88398.1 antibiotic biosynthesis monooxygenase [Sulfitobacter donghicola DSW-25 = KCTC 12864 = JCM 14565]KIN69736.1 Antibiotic biosynthesis monooxygenase [Sulfitobacter donghicola DSW-25 = KCTC 12864 = JCM 14565]